MTFIFQGNPERFAIDDYLTRYQPFVYWSAPKLQQSMNIGDRAVIWRSGHDAGVVAVGSISELPSPISDLKNPAALGDDLWREEEDSPSDIKVGITIDEVRLSPEDGMLTREQLKDDPDFKNSTIITSPQGSVFGLKAEEGDRIETLWEMPHQSFYRYFKDELVNPDTQYFILDTKGGGAHGDLDFVKYQWSRSKYNLAREGDLAIFRRPQTASNTGKFYFFGAAKLETVTGDDRVTAQLSKTYPFQEYLHPDDLDSLKWVWKERGNTWEHYFNQYGMNKITKVDFISVLHMSEMGTSEADYDPEAATEAIQNIQNKDYSAEDKESLTKTRSGQEAFSNEVKTNYRNRCAICGLATKQFLVGSHIIPWSKRKDTRLDPSNGICLCSIHDKAFDKGFITVDEKYRVVLSENISEDGVLIGLLKKHSKKKLKAPKENPPKQEFLAYHRTKVFEDFLD